MNLKPTILTFLNDKFNWKCVVRAGWLYVDNWIWKFDVGKYRVNDIYCWILFSFLFYDFFFFRHLVRFNNIFHSEHKTDVYAQSINIALCFSISNFRYQMNDCLVYKRATHTQILEKNKLGISIAFHSYPCYLYTTKIEYNDHNNTHIFDMIFVTIIVVRNNIHEHLLFN